MPVYDPGPPFEFTSGFRPDNRKDHGGVDFKADQLTPIPCAAQGVVVGRGYHRDDQYGYMAIVKHHNPTTPSLDWYTFYAHMPSECLIPSIGTSVARGQAIGVVGNTGYSTNPHLHFELIWAVKDTKWSVDDPWEGGALGIPAETTTMARVNPLAAGNWEGLDVYQGGSGPVEAPSRSCPLPSMYGAHVPM